MSGLLTKFSGRRMPGGCVLAVAARQLAVSGIGGHEDRHHRCHWRGSIPGLRVGQPRSIEGTGLRSCALAVTRPRRAGCSPP